MNPIVAISIYLGSLVALLLGVGWISAKVEIPPELRRKAVHVGMGLATLTFPLVFQSALPVVALALLSALLLLFLRRFPSLKCNGAIHGVTRKTWGDLYFVLGILVAFVLAVGHPVFYTIAVLTLTFADPAAALAGQRSDPARTPRKTTVGSFAFFAVAFACASIPLVSADPTPVSMFVALGFALFVTSVEALSHCGSDNFTIPVAGSAYFLLPPPIQIVLPLILAVLTISITLNERRRLATAS